MRNVAVAAVAATLTLGAVCLTACAPEQPPQPVEADGVGGNPTDGTEENRVSEK